MATFGVPGVPDDEPSWPDPPSAPEGAPDVVFVLLDDVGFAQLGCFGGDIETPNIDRLASRGLQYSNFHATPLCSPTRAALLTGRNPHSVGFGTIAERAIAHPGYNGILPDTAAALPDVLHQHGYTSFALGKWHLVPAFETGPAGPFDRWPLGRGFDRFYGFLGASSDQYSPALYRDNTRATQPSRAGYHLTEDLADTAIGWLTELEAAAPEQRFFLYLATGAGHAPHQVPAEWVERYRGRFEKGWDEARQRVFERQKALGLIPAETDLPPSNPGVQQWDELSHQERTVFARMMEVYAGFISHTDHHLGRLIDHLDRIGRLDNTLFVLTSDNGASADGGPNGTLSEGLLHNDMPQTFDDVMSKIDEIGGPNHYNNYPWGWAQSGNTPLRWYKSFTHEGGVREPLIIHWPAASAVPGLRRQYHYITDLFATVLEAAGISAPTTVRGQTQQPVDGISMAYTLREPDAPSARHEQHFELYGNRAIWSDGWKAVSRLQPDAPGNWPPAPMEHDLLTAPWELYDLDVDPSETRDLAMEHPERLEALTAGWWRAAERDRILPLDGRPRHERWGVLPPPPGSNPSHLTFYGPCGPLERGVAPKLLGGPFRMQATMAAHPEVGGVLIAIGGRHGGYCWRIRDSRLIFDVNLMTRTYQIVSDPLVLPATTTVEVSFTPEQPEAGSGGALAFRVDGQDAGGGTVPRMLKVYPLGSGRVQVGGDEAPTVSLEYEPPHQLNTELTRLDVWVGSAKDDDARAFALELDGQ